MGASLKQVIGVVIALAVIAALVAIVNPLRRGGVEPVESKEVTLPQLTNSVNEFTVDILRLMNRGEGNFVISPMNLYVALLLLYEGTGSETAKQVAEALHLPPGSTACRAYGELVNKLPVGSEGDAKLLIANGVWLRKDFPFREGYVSRVEECFNATVKQFSSVNGLSDEINSWVARRTNGMIRKLVGELTRDTEAVLVSALYFKGVWVKEFEYMGKLTFHAPSGDVEADFMKVTQELRVVKNGDYVAVEIPYRNTSIAMLIIMPENLKDFVENLTYPQLNSIIQAVMRAEPKEVEVIMPKFYVESKYSMVSTLKTLGIKDVFGSNADFSKMAHVGEGVLRVSQVIHAAAINVTEKGTEASAATAVTIVLTAVPSNPQETVRIDRPFLYLLIDTSTGTILFAGETYNPTT